MAVREVPLERISLELFGDVAGDTPVDQEEPLVVIEEGEKFFLVDGFKRFFALRAQGARAAWVIGNSASWSGVRRALLATAMRTRSLALRVAMSGLWACTQES